MAVLVVEEQQLVARARAAAVAQLLFSDPLPNDFPKPPCLSGLMAGTRAAVGAFFGVWVDTPRPRGNTLVGLSNLLLLVVPWLMFGAVRFGELAWCALLAETILGLLNDYCPWDVPETWRARWCSADRLGAVLGASVIAVRAAMRLPLFGAVALMASVLAAFRLSCGAASDAEWVWRHCLWHAVSSATAGYVWSLP